MTRIDFYQIETTEPATTFCCRLVSKAYRQGHQIYVHALTKQQAEEIDDLLWTLKKESFIPHSMIGAKDGARVDAPIHIGYGPDPHHHEDVMVNMTGQIPDFFSRFERVAEIVPFNENMRESARTNYRFYRDRGYSLKYHQLKS